MLVRCLAAYVLLLFPYTSLITDGNLENGETFAIEMTGRIKVGRWKPTGGFFVPFIATLRHLISRHPEFGGKRGSVGLL